jgi:integrase
MARPSKPWFRQQRNGWYVTVDGKKIALGVTGKANRAAAEQAWHRLMAGHEPTPAPATTPVATPAAAPATAPVTVAEAVALFTDNTPHVKPSTRELYARHLARLIDGIGELQLARVTGLVLSRWVQKLAVGPTTRGIVLRSVSAFFGWCARQELIPKNPARQVPAPPARSRGREAVIPADVHAKLLAAAPPALRTFLELLHATGARPGELCRLTAAAFDADNGVAVLTEHKSDHTGRPRLIFFPPAAAARVRELAERHPAGPLLRNSHGRPWKPKAVAWALNRLCRRLKVKVIAYGFRHTFATDALAAGVPDAQVAALLGHGSTAMLHRHYSHITSRAALLREVAAQVR